MNAKEDARVTQYLNLVEKFNLRVTRDMVALDKTTAPLQFVWLVCLNYVLLVITNLHKKLGMKSRYDAPYDMRLVIEEKLRHHTWRYIKEEIADGEFIPTVPSGNELTSLMFQELCPTGNPYKYVFVTMCNGITKMRQMLWEDSIQVQLDVASAMLDSVIENRPTAFKCDKVGDVGLFERMVDSDEPPKKAPRLSDIKFDVDEDPRPHRLGSKVSDFNLDGYKKFMEVLIKILLKFNILTISEAFDLPCDVYQQFMSEENYRFYIRPALEIIRQRARKLQCLDRWDYMRSCIEDHKPHDHIIKIVKDIFVKQGIDIKHFARDLKIVLNGEEDKVRCFKMTGAINSGKSLISQAIADMFLTCRLTMNGCASEFYYSGMLQQSLILLEEVFLTTATSDDFKSILSGYPMSVNIKSEKNRETLKNTPSIITSNFDQFGRGYLCGTEEAALTARCKVYKFKCAIKPGVKLCSKDVVYTIVKSLE